MNDATIQFNIQDVPLYPNSFKPSFDRLTNGSFHFPPGLEHNILFGIFIFFMLGYAIVSGVLFYHWYTYGMKNPLIFWAEIVFSTVSIFLCIMAFQVI